MYAELDAEAARLKQAYTATQNRGREVERVYREYYEKKAEYDQAMKTLDQVFMQIRGYNECDFDYIMETAGVTATDIRKVRQV